MARIFYVIIGGILISLAILSIVSGEALGLGTIDTANRRVTPDNNFLEFYSVVILDWIIRIVLIKKSYVDSTK